MHGGDRIAEALVAEGVRFLFTLCGGHISPILTGAKARGLRVVDVRHEATAVFAADAVARLTGVPGVAAVTAGPGLTNTLTAVKNAQLAQSPVVLLGGAAPTMLQGRGALQDIAQLPLIAPHVKHARSVRRVRELAPAIHDAFRIARQGVPGPVFLECPLDVLYPEAAAREWFLAGAGKGGGLAARARRRYLERYVERMFASGGGRPVPRPSAVALPRPAPAAVRRAARMLGQSRHPVLLVGSQALALAADAPRIAAAVARLGIPVYLSGMGRGLLGREHPLQLRHQRRQALREADCVILAGVPSDFRLDYGGHVRTDARLIAANRSRREARMNRRPDLLVAGDAGEFLCSLSALLAGSAARPEWVAQLRSRDAEREHDIERRAVRGGERVNPLALHRAIERTAGENAVFVADGGDFVATASYVLHPRGPLSWLDPGVFGTLGVGAGFALGAKLCRPTSEVWLILGDGASGYGLVEFDTFVRHGVPVIAVVGNDGAWTQIAREQTKALGDDVATVLGPVRYDEVARGFGARGLRLESDAAIGAVLSEARAAAAAGTPVLVNAMLDRSDFREGSISM
ncbi:MAG: thiamine pyrophosphate-binding protein [Gammaproteobacteria bacterium]|nr:thiamine pyrophosphate-binding protein [Gammaproteobacteria bacterium]